MSEETPIIPETKLPTAEELKKENDALELEIARRQKIKDQLYLAGRAEGAEPVKEETFQDKWRREAKERYKGTGMDPTL